MSKGVMKAYKGFLEGLEVYNTVAGGLGQPYTRPASIPQGDPPHIDDLGKRVGLKSGFSGKEPF